MRLYYYGTLAHWIQRSSLKMLPRKSFYGASSSVTKTLSSRVEKKVLQFSSQPFPMRYHTSGVFDVKSIWKTFYRQSDAYEFLKTVKQAEEQLVVFSYESKTLSTGGGRMYLVTSLDKFWHYYSQRSLDGRRHSYEVIREGQPCKLYFDLEFNKSVNQDRDGEKMTRLLVEYILKQMQSHFNCQPTLDDVVDLDSSTDKKFSRHIILNNMNCIFTNNVTVGNFVHHMYDALNYPCDNCCHIEDTSQLRSAMHVCDSKGQQTTFCDMGVYTKNRNFRLYMSSKLGQGKPALKPSSNYLARLAEREANFSKMIFIDSLIGAALTSSSEKGFYSPKLLQFDVTEKAVPGVIHRRIRSEFDTTAVTAKGYKESPFPQVDDYVRQHVIIKGGTQGEIRRWSYMKDAGILTFDIIKNRWCGNIQRQHKSNNIMIVVNTNIGVWYQKCHDPECGDYRSESQRLSDQARESLGLFDHLSNDFLQDLSDADWDAASPEKPKSSEQDDESWASDDSTFEKYF